MNDYLIMDNNGLFEFVKKYSRFMRRLDIESTRSGIFPAEIRILEALAEASQNQTDLCAHTLMDRAQVSRCVKALLRKADICSLPTATPRRAKYGLTARGARRLDELNDVRWRALVDAVRKMPAYEQMELVQAANDITPFSSDYVLQNKITYRKMHDGEVGLASRCNLSDMQGAARSNILLSKH